MTYMATGGRVPCTPLTGETVPFQSSHNQPSMSAFFPVPRVCSSRCTFLALRNMYREALFTVPSLL